MQERKIGYKYYNIVKLTGGDSVKKWIAGLLVFCMCMTGMVSQALAVAEIEADASIDCVMIIPIDDVVELGLSSYLERNIAKAEEVGADLIILALDTPGGRVDAAQDIKRILYDCDIKTIAFVKDQAISAGAYIAMCCDEIVMAPGQAETTDFQWNQVTNTGAWVAPQQLTLWGVNTAVGASVPLPFQIY